MKNMKNYGVKSDILLDQSLTTQMNLTNNENQI